MYVGAFQNGGIISRVKWVENNGDRVLAVI